MKTIKEIILFNDHDLNHHFTSWVKSRDFPIDLKRIDRIFSCPIENRLYKRCLLLEVDSIEATDPKMKIANLVDILFLIDRHGEAVQGNYFFSHYKAKIHYNLAATFDQFSMMHDWSKDELKHALTAHGQFVSTELEYIAHCDAAVDIQYYHNAQALVVCLQYLGTSDLNQLEAVITAQKKTLRQQHQKFYLFDTYSLLARLCSVLFNCFVNVITPVSEDMQHYINLNVDELKTSLTSLLNHATSQGEGTIWEVQQRFKALMPDETPDQASHQQGSRKRRKKVQAINPIQKKVKRPVPPSLCPIDELKQALVEYDSSSSAFLRPYQQVALQALAQSARTQDRLFLTMATGTGKTAHLTMLAHILAKKGPVIILVPSIQLVLQTEEKLRQYEQHSTELSGLTEYLGVYCPSLHRLETSLITIITYSSFSRLKLHVSPQDQAPDSLAKDCTKAIYAEKIAQWKTVNEQGVDFYDPKHLLHVANTAPAIIADEGHHLNSTTIRRWLEVMDQAHARQLVISLSASTLPGEYPDLEKLGFEHAYILELRESIERQILSPLQIFTIDFSMFKEAKEVSRLIRSRQALTGRTDLNREDQENVNTLIETNNGFNYTALSILLQVLQKKTTKLTIVFARSIEHAHLLYAMLEELIAQMPFAQHPLFLYHSNLSDLVRSSALADYKQSKQGILVCVDALSEGFDVEDINVAIDFRTYKERIRRMVQTLGRILRRDQDMPDSPATYICIKLLFKDLQKLARSALFENRGIIGQPNAEEVINADFNLNLPVERVFNINDNHVLIKPSPARVLLPKETSTRSIGLPPESKEVGDADVVSAAQPDTLSPFISDLFGFFGDGDIDRDDDLILDAHLNEDDDPDDTEWKDVFDSLEGLHR